LLDEIEPSEILLKKNEKNVHVFNYSLKISTKKKEGKLKKIKEKSSKFFN
jgi:hypothetical protein